MKCLVIIFIFTVSFGPSSPLHSKGTDRSWVYMLDGKKVLAKDFEKLYHYDFNFLRDLKLVTSLIDAHNILEESELYIPNESHDKKIKSFLNDHVNQKIIYHNSLKNKKYKELLTTDTLQWIKKYSIIRYYLYTKRIRNLNDSRLKILILYSKKPIKNKIKLLINLNKQINPIEE